MMSAEKNICPSCGSSISGDASVCDICGEDLTAASPDRAAVAASAVAPTGTSAAALAAADAARTKPAVLPPARKKAAAKPAVRAAGSKGAALFTTWQWIAIVIAAFILGGVVGASFMPSAREGTTASQEQSGTQPSAQPDLQALESARVAAEADPADADAQLTYANGLHDAMMLDQAIAQYKKYLELDPGNPDARVDLGICYFEKKEYAAAIAEMERAIAEHPEHQLGTYNLGIVNLNAGNKDKAREWLQKARDLDPASPHGQNAAQLLEQHF
jgi:Tfp pilus assembly protein PilF